MKRSDSKYALIVQQALQMANSIGLEAVTLGTLADGIGMSKSGLFAHFKSKEALQLAVIERAVEQFRADVVLPTLAAPRGWPQVQALFAHYLAWLGGEVQQGTCFFVASSQEFDDQPGALRDALHQALDDWRGFIARLMAPLLAAAPAGEGNDAEQFAFDFIGLTMSYQLAHKMLRDPQAEARLRHAFAGLLQRYGYLPDA